MKKNWTLKCQLRSKLDPLVVVESPIVLDTYETKHFYTWDKADIGLADFDIKDNELILDFILEKDSVKLLAKQIAFPAGELNFNDIGMDHVYARQNVEMSYMCKKNKQKQWATIEIHLVSVRGFPAYDLVNSHKRGHKVTCMINNTQYLSRPQECLTGQEDRLYQWLPPDDGLGGAFEGLSPRTVTSRKTLQEDASELALIKTNTTNPISVSFDYEEDSDEFTNACSKLPFVIAADSMLDVAFYNFKCVPPLKIECKLSARQFAKNGVLFSPRKNAVQKRSLFKKKPTKDEPIFVNARIAEHEISENLSLKIVFLPVQGEEKIKIMAVRLSVKHYKKTLLNMF